MATLAFFFLALMPLQEDPALSTKITWVFTEKSCHSCVEKQLEIMQEFLRPQDRIVLHDVDRPWFGKRKPGPVENMIRDRFPDLADQIITDGTESRDIKTGWRWMDPLTDEVICFSGAPGGYSALRSKAMLKVLR